MSTFLNALHSGRVLLMDGAMGTELQRAGLKSGESSASWNLLHPERVRIVHNAYVAAGASVLLANTFQMPSNLSPWFAHEQVTSICTQGASLAACVRRTVAGWILADIGPIIVPGSNLEFEDVGNVSVLSNFTAPVDAILLETCSSPRVRYAVQRAVGNAWGKPVLLSLTYLRNPAAKLVTFSGHAPEWFAERAARWGVGALGVNCGREISVGDCAEIVRRYRQVTDLPLFARPNAGTPKKVRGRWVYPLTPSAMAERLPELLEAGVSMVGGCCGTTPAHIAAMRPVVKRWNARRRK